jgi:hypothetical protein
VNQNLKQLLTELINGQIGGGWNIGYWIAHSNQYTNPTHWLTRGLGSKKKGFDLKSRLFLRKMFQKLWLLTGFAITDKKIDYIKSVQK